MKITIKLNQILIVLALVAFIAASFWSWSSDTAIESYSNRTGLGALVFFIRLLNIACLVISTVLGISWLIRNDFKFTINLPVGEREVEFGPDHPDWKYYQEFLKEKDKI